MIIVVSKLLFWFAIFRSDDRTIDRRVDLDHLAISRGYQSRSNRRTKLVEWTVRPIQAEDLTCASVEINRVWGLNPDTTERRGIRGYEERVVSHGIEQGNGSHCACKITRRNRHSVSSFEFVTMFVVSTLLNIEPFLG